MKRSLVSGASGFLGSHLVDALLTKGHEVVGVDNLISGDLENLTEARARKGFAFIQADVSEPLDVPGTFTHVWHLASPASPPDFLRFPLETMKAGSHGTEQLLEVARRGDARFLLASTSEIYGDPEVSPQAEDYLGRVNPTGPRSVYDEAKRYAEAMTMAYHRKFAVPTRIARIFNTYGPRMRLDDGRVIPNLFGQILRRQPLAIWGDGTQTRSFCYYSDLIAGLLALMDSRETAPVNLGNPEELSINQLAQRMQAIAGTRLPVTYQPLPMDDPRQRRPDISRAKNVIGWSPLVDLDQGLKWTWAYFRRLAPDATPTLKKRSPARRKAA